MRDTAWLRQIITAWHLLRFDLRAPAQPCLLTHRARTPGFTVRDGAILLNAIKLILPVQSPSRNYFACLVGQINSTSFSRLVPSERGVSRSSRTLGTGCGGRGSVVRANGWLQGGSNMDFRERTAGVQTSDAEADGKTVWSWHPLLMSSWRRHVDPTGCGRAANSSTTVTRRIRRRGERAISR